MEDKIGKRIGKERSILIILCIVLILTNFFFIYKLSPLNLKIFNGDPKIIYKNSLSLSQLEFAKDMINDLKPLYFKSAKSYTFTADQKDVGENVLTNRLFRNESEVKTIAGSNYNGNIILYLSDDLEFDRQALCHEITHSILSVSNSEPYSYDLMSTKFCFRDDTNSKCNEDEVTLSSRYYYEGCWFYNSPFSNPNLSSYSLGINRIYQNG